MSRSALSSCSLVNSKGGWEPFPFLTPFSCPVSLTMLFFGAAMAIPDERKVVPLYPNSNRHERVARCCENLAIPQCNAGRHSRNCFRKVLKFDNHLGRIAQTRSRVFAYTAAYP